jgi:hypothetical protein
MMPFGQLLWILGWIEANSRTAKAGQRRLELCLFVDEFSDHGSGLVGHLERGELARRF